eukprot:7690063-Pyramimonas_sp.AAC.1
MEANEGGKGRRMGGGGGGGAPFFVRGLLMGCLSREGAEGRELSALPILPVDGVLAVDVAIVA